MEHSEHCVEAYPQQRDEHDSVVVFDDDVRLAGLDVVALELFLAAGTLERTGEKSQRHLDDEHDEDYDDRDFTDDGGVENVEAVDELMENILIDQHRKDADPDDKSDVMVNADFCDFRTFHCKPLFKPKYNLSLPFIIQACVGIRQ